MITIYGIDEKLTPIREKMSNTLHRCMVNILGLPEDKRAHRFIPVARENFYYPQDRSDAYTVIEINMMAGRTKQTQKALIKSIFVAFNNDLGIQPADVEITITEQPPHCWGFRGITGDEARLSYKVNV